jgi:glycosyltransferase involved in cell wall biosynthesis
VKVALVCDWLTEVGGAEKVLLAVHKMFPDAPIYTSQYRPKHTTWFDQADIRTGWMNVLPTKLRRFTPFLRNWYFGRLDLSSYDLVISIVNAEAKGIVTHGKHHSAFHIAYLQGPPTQYYWGLYDQYIANPGFGKLNFLARLGLKALVQPLRKVDHKFAQKPDVLLANSTYVHEEIKKYYGRESTIIWPSVDTESTKKAAANIKTNQHSGFIISGRQVSWKRIDLAIKACQITGDELLVIGHGPEHKRLVKLAADSENIRFLPRYNGADEIVKYLKSAKAFIFPSLEPFGITPIEALASGTPVIALRKGGALDIIKDGKNGIFFDEQTPESLFNAIKRFKKMKFDSGVVSASADKFSNTKFREQMQKFVEKTIFAIISGHD